jgi:hypothetical protein
MPLRAVPDIKAGELKETLKAIPSQRMHGAGTHKATSLQGADLG